MCYSLQCEHQDPYTGTCSPRHRALYDCPHMHAEEMEEDEVRDDLDGDDSDDDA